MFNLLESLDLGCGVGAGRDSEDVFTVSICTGGGGGGQKIRNGRSARSCLLYRSHLCLLRILEQ